MRALATNAAAGALRDVSAKTMRVFAAAVLAAGMFLGAGAAAFSPEKAYAADDPYAYTVRVYSGAQGTFVGGSDCYTFPPLAAGTQVEFHQGDVKLKDDSKYYVRGWKLAGHDNDNSTLFGSLPVDSDMDLVVCYGILGDNVGYTVRYVDAAGNELLPTETFYGNVGDSPVLAYRYVEGYLPQAYNLTGELYADASQNVYTFTYSPVATPEDITVITPTVIPQGAGAQVTTPGAGAGDAAATPENAPAVAVDGTQNEEVIAEDGTPLAQPAEIEDIRDEETPLASANALARTDVPGEGAVLFSPTNMATILGCAAVAMVAIALALVFMYRKKEHQAAAAAARASISSRYAGASGAAAASAASARMAYPQSQPQPYAPSANDVQRHAGQPYGAVQYQAPYDPAQYAGGVGGQQAQQVPPQQGMPFGGQADQQGNGRG